MQEALRQLGQVALIVGSLVGLAYFLAWLLRGRAGQEFESLRALLPHLDEPFLRTHYGDDAPSLSDTALDGRLEGRRLRLWFDRAEDHPDRPLRLFLRLDVHDPRGEFHLYPAGPLDRLGRWLEPDSFPEIVDLGRGRRFCCAGAKAALDPQLASPAQAANLAALLQSPTIELRLLGDELILQRGLRQQFPAPEELWKLVQALARCAGACERGSTR